MKRDNFKNQSGQATAELIVSIIGIMIVFTGFFMVVDLGVAKVENVISARGGADLSSYIGDSGGSGSAIISWSSGGDGFYYTEDDLPLTATSESPETFSSELQNGSFSLLSNFSMFYIENNFATTLDPDSVFLPAADLTFVTRSQSVELDDATRALYFNTPSITVTDTIYMPIIE